MNLLDILLMASVFLFVFCLVMVFYLGWTESKLAEKQAIKKRLLYISAGGKHGQDKIKNYRDKVLRDVGGFEQLALKMPRISKLDRMLLKTTLPLNTTTFLVLTVALGLIGFLLGLKLLPHFLMAILAGLVLASLPFGYLKIAENTYYAKFQEQLPEALDLLARALRSGHALTSGLDMVGTEMLDPIKSEFGATVDEINLGLTFQDAFENLCERVPSTDLRFFTISLLIQRETGGNVAEILDNISRLIRERIQFRRQVKALTAEGRMSAMVLVALPIVLFIYIYFVNRDYIALLWQEQMGQYMLLGAVVLQIIGAFVIRRIVDVEL